MHLECHNRTISGPNYVTLLSSISRIESTFFLSLYELPLLSGVEYCLEHIVFLSPHPSPPRTMSPESHPLKEAPAHCFNFRTMFWCLKERLNTAPAPSFLAFSFFISSQIHRKEVNKKVTLSYGLQFVSGGENIGGLVVAFYTREPNALRKDGTCSANLAPAFLAPHV